MLASQLINAQFPLLDTDDKVSFALQLMSDFDIQQLPVVTENIFLGLIDKDDLLDANENDTLETLNQSFIKLSILPDEHFLFALRLCAELGLAVVPVVSKEKELVGIITPKDLLHALNTYVGQDEPGGIIVMEMEKKSYSFGEISRLVETNDAAITQLNSSVNKSNGIFTVTIKVNKLEISDIIATLQRYDYNIIYYFGEELYENELKENYDLLMNYLRM